MINSEKYFAVYDAACSLAILIEHIERGYAPRKDDILVKAAKIKLRKLADESEGFFTRFERV